MPRFKKSKKTTDSGQNHDVPIAKVGGVRGIWDRTWHSKKKRTAIIVVMVIVFAFVVGFAFRQYQLEQRRKDEQQAQVDRLVLDSTMNKATNLMLDGKYDESNQVIQDYLKTNPRKEYLASVYSALAVNALNQNKPEEAKRYFEEARKTATDIERYGVLTGLAQVETQLGNKEQAIKYYEEAIASLGEINPADANTQGDKALAEYQIQQLRGQQ